MIRSELAAFCKEMGNQTGQKKSKRGREREQNQGSQRGCEFNVPRQESTGPDQNSCNLASLSHMHRLLNPALCTPSGGSPETSAVVSLSAGPGERKMKTLDFAPFGFSVL